MKKIWVFYIPYRRYLFHNYWTINDSHPTIETDNGMYYFYGWTDKKKIAKLFSNTRNSSVKMIKKYTTDETYEKLINEFDYLYIDIYTVNKKDKLCITESEYDVITNQTIEFLQDLIGDEYLYDNWFRFKDEYVKAFYTAGLDLLFYFSNRDIYEYFDLTRVFSGIFYELL